MCTTNQVSHANQPENRSLPISTMARLRPIVAIWPLSTKRKASRGLPARSRRIVLATKRPCCIATGAVPGSGLPVWWVKLAWSPATNAFGCPSMLRSLPTTARPCSSTSKPSRRTNSTPRTPAAQSMVEAWTRSGPTSTPSSSILVTRLFGQTCTPSFSKSRVARLACFSLNDGRIRGPDSMRMTRVSLVSILRKSLASVKRLISPIAPANSTPVGPPPITTNVNNCRRLAESPTRSAASKELSRRRRISVACGTVFRLGAYSSQLA